MMDTPTTAGEGGQGLVHPAGKTLPENWHSAYVNDIAMSPRPTRTEPVDHHQLRFGPGCSACGSIDFLYECLHCGFRYCPDHHGTGLHLCRTLALQAVFDRTTPVTG